MKYFKLILIILIISGCGFKSKYKKLEEEFLEISFAYYEEYIVGRYELDNLLQITLSDLEANEYDIKNFIKNKCDMNSYVFIEPIYDNGVVIDYEIESFLTCGSYQTPKD